MAHSDQNLSSIVARPMKVFSLIVHLKSGFSNFNGKIWTNPTSYSQNIDAKSSYSQHIAR
jgi:hypothetical protein